jgi:FecR-like protein
MVWREFVRTCLAASWLSIVLAPPVQAASDQIGLAAVVRNSVSEIEPNKAKILQGDSVFKDEVVATEDDSSAKFVLKDSTNLMLGPGSRLKLDHAVFSDEKSVGDILIKLTLGSFRFITGHSAKEAYVITTPIATMGVRGTTLDFLIEQTQNTVVLKEGQSRVCAGGRCVELTKPGDTAIVKSYGTRIDIDLQPSSSWSFDSACNGMCSPMSFAEAEDALTTGSIGGAGGGGGGTGPIGSGSGSPTGFLPATTPPQPQGKNAASSPPSLTSGSGSGGFFPVSPQ